MTENEKLFQMLFQMMLQASEDMAMVKMIRNVIESDKLVNGEKTEIIGVMLGVECRKWKPAQSGEPSV